MAKVSPRSQQQAVSIDNNFRRPASPRRRVAPRRNGREAHDITWTSRRGDRRRPPYRQCRAQGGTLMPALATIAAAAAGLAVPAIAGGLALFTRHVERKVEAALPPQGIFVDVPGARLHVREQGRGPALLMIHGLGGHMSHFTYEVARRLAHHHRVITVDRPGSGYSTRHPGAPAGLREQAAALAALIDRLELEQPLVVGHSYGGAVALALALDYPERVAGLSLLAPLTHLPDETPAAFRVLDTPSPLLRRLMAWTVATPGAIARGGAVLEQVFAPDPVPHDFATRGGACSACGRASSSPPQRIWERYPGSCPATAAGMVNCACRWPCCSDGTTASCRGASTARRWPARYRMRYWKWWTAGTCCPSHKRT
ncbi:alpha/beta fold hydrolase [Pseudoduganella lutea]|uniref:alpha/beta fold hydrolase n=1 Tax=Pseudoduganella lutea TaxID=321985 RepID=UPI001E57FE67|nr:alpha/beta fold hydrolase [Pseudoduganella lutea]